MDELEESSFVVGFMVVEGIPGRVQDLIELFGKSPTSGWFDGLLTLLAFAWTMSGLGYGLLSFLFLFMLD